MSTEIIHPPVRMLPLRQPISDSIQGVLEQIQTSGNGTLRNNWVTQAFQTDDGEFEVGYRYYDKIGDPYSSLQVTDLSGRFSEPLVKPGGVDIYIPPGVVSLVQFAIKQGRDSDMIVVPIGATRPEFEGKGIMTAFFDGMEPLLLATENICPDVFAGHGIIMTMQDVARAQTPGKDHYGYTGRMAMLHDWSLIRQDTKGNYYAKRLR